MKQKLILLTVCLTALFAFSTTYYVDASRSDDSGAATNWATAKQTIQAAVDLTVDGDTVLVTNGVYDAGGKVTPGYSLTNRVCIINAITVRSVNGPEVTIIKGAVGSNGSNDVNAIRGVYMKNGCSLTGFTVTNGYTLGDSGDLDFDCSGGSVWIATNCIASNCVMNGSSANYQGGGAYLYYGGILNNCTLTGNRAYRGGGAYLAIDGTLNDCMLSRNSVSADGGGVLLNFGGTLNNCTLDENSAGNDGAGAYLIWGGILNACTLSGNSASIYGGGVLLNSGGILNNCLLDGNRADWSGGGVYLTSGGTLNNCTLSGNLASEDGGGAVLRGNATVNNSIVWNNNSSFRGMDIFSTGSENAVRYTCASDGVTNGIDGCITSDPLFVDASNSNFQLQASSLGINTGNNTYAPTNVTSYDLADNLRINGETVDMGAYENSSPMYLITTDAGANGCIIPASLWVAKGADKTFLIQPDPGYHVDSLMVDEVPVLVDLSYTFTNVQTVHTIAATFETIVHTPVAYYVDASRPDDSGDGLSWATAKKVIQSAVDLATDEDTVWVTNGVYGTGGSVAPIYTDSYGSYTNSLSNRVCITKAVTVQSVNGPETTIIQGSTDAVRCAYLCPGAVLNGFTLTGGYTAQEGGGEFFDHFGGGAFLMTNAVLDNCILSENVAIQAGGAFLWGGTLNNCLVIANNAQWCGGVSVEFGASLNNCTVVGNAPGGVLCYYGTVNNCIVWGNNDDDNFIYPEQSTIRYTCSSPLLEGEGNICADPMFRNPLSNFRLKQGSPCIDAGWDAYAASNDLDGVSRPVDGDLDGYAYADMGCYELSAASLPKTYYVNASRPNDSGDGLSWESAKQTIQAAVDLATDEDTVWVTNGVYDGGGMVAPDYESGYGSLVVNTVTNRIFVTNAVIVRSVNGPEMTVIQGSGTTRCAYLKSGAVLEGFTLTGGHAVSGYSGMVFRDGGWTNVVGWVDGQGGGALLFTNAVLSRCILSGNSGDDGGGACCWEGGTLNNCLLTGNMSGIAGGISGQMGTLNNCTVTKNTATNEMYGTGGIDGYALTVNNCIIWGNFGRSVASNISEYTVADFRATCSSPLMPGDGNICVDPMFKNPLNNFRLKQGSLCIDAGWDIYAPTNDLGGVSRPVDGDTDGYASADMGCYELSPTALPKAYYVDASRPDDTGDGLSWETAKKVIQSAVDLATDEDTVLVTNGVYDTGGMVAPVYVDSYGYSYANSLTNRVCITTTITVRSVNGPDVTVIQGSGTVRCAYLCSGAILEGFTLTKGCTVQGDGGELFDRFGGGSFLNAGANLNNCILQKNSAVSGGGVALWHGGTLNNCLLVDNSAAYGGGAFVSEGILNNCTASQNTALYRDYSNYTVIGEGGGVLLQGGELSNCIIWGNFALDSGDNIEMREGTVRYTCSSPLLSGEGNICINPQLGAPEFIVNLPCNNAGNNSYVLMTNELRGNPRIIGGVVDMGAYENQMASSDADDDDMDDLWELNQFGGRHFADPGTICSNGVNTLRQAYIAGLDPNNPDSVFQAAAFRSPLSESVLQWQGVSGRVYSVWFSTNLLNGFQLLEPNIPWTAGAFTDTVHNVDGQGYYKIEVNLE